jgi:amino acid transporter
MARTYSRQVSARVRKERLADRRRQQRLRTVAILGAVGLVVAALGLVLLAASVTGGFTARPAAPGKIELATTEFDFGSVPNTQPVSQVFEVRNVGQGSLQITGVSTSCGCTTAQTSSSRLAPGEATDLTVTYDPQAHDGALGDFLRVVYIRSDDPEMPEASLTIRVTVVEP